MSSPATDTRPVVWIGTAGTGTAYGLARSFRDHWGAGLVLIGSDINHPWLVATSLLTDHFVVVPPVASPSFAATMCALLEAHRVDVYLPILDEEIVWAAEARETGLLPPTLAVVAPSVAHARICFDKLATFDWLRSVALPTIDTQRLATAKWDGAPLFAKLRCGRGSLGAEPVDTAERLATLQASGADLVIQPRCAPPEVTVDAIRWPGGLRAVARERLEVKAGVCTKARVFEDEGLAALARAIGDGLDLRGAFCFQVMRQTPDGPFVVTDINPRPGAGTRLSVAAGVDILAATLADRLGLPVAPFLPQLPHERFVARQYTEHVLR
jgi:carbamoyl-phosphate synthase large subunit